MSGRSTKATDVDPVIACVGDRTHHVIENLDADLVNTFKYSTVRHIVYNFHCSNLHYVCKRCLSSDLGNINLVMDRNKTTQMG